MSQKEEYPIETSLSNMINRATDFLFPRKLTVAHLVERALWLSFLFACFKVFGGGY